MPKDTGGWKSAASAYGNDPWIPRSKGKKASDMSESAAGVYGKNLQVGKGGGGGKGGGRRKSSY